MPRRDVLRLAVVGRGRAGRSLATALRATRGVSVTLHARGAVGASLARADVVVLAVPDDAIERVAAFLARHADLRRPAVALHMAGALGPKALGPLARRVRGLGVLHPLQSLTDPARGARSLRGAIFAVAGNRTGLGMARRIARILGGRPVRVPERGRALYHAAASITSGGVVAVLDVAERAMIDAGLDRASARRGLLALLRGTVANVEASGPAAALTGPVARGDRGTIRRHRRALAGLGPAAVAVYDALVRAARRPGGPAADPGGSGSAKRRRESRRARSV